MSTTWVSQPRPVMVRKELLQLADLVCEAAYHHRRHYEIRLGGVTPEFHQRVEQLWERHLAVDLLPEAVKDAGVVGSEIDVQLLQYALDDIVLQNNGEAPL